MDKFVDFFRLIIIISIIIIFIDSIISMNIAAIILNNRQFKKLKFPSLELQMSIEKVTKVSCRVDFKNQTIIETLLISNVVNFLSAVNECSL
jgi:hypothetical protein